MYRIFFLSFLILGFFIFANEVWAENQIKFNMEGESASFDSENNSVKIRITAEDIFLQPSLKKPEQFTFSLESDDKLHITSFKYGDAIGGTSEIVKTPLKVSLLKTHSDLKNIQYLTEVQNISITTDKILINPVQDVTTAIYSNTISVGESDILAFPDATMFSMSIPQGSSEYYVVLSDDAKVIINGMQHTPVGEWKDKAIILTLDSNGLKSLTTRGNFFIVSHWKDLKIDWQEKFDFNFYDIKGELAVDEPKRVSLDLARADDVKLQNVQGEVIIKKLENTFQVSSRGIAELLEVNKKNILEEEWSFSGYVNQNLGPIAIILTIGVSIFPFFKWIYPKIRRKYSDYRFKKAIDDGSYAKMMNDFEDHLNR